MIDIIMKYVPHLIMLFSILGLFVSLKKMLSGYNSKNWDTVEANLLEATLEKHSTREISRIMYTPSIKYEYFYKGQKYIGNKLSYHANVLMEKDAANIVISRYIMKENFEIRVNPKKPGSSVIESGVDYSHLGVIATCLFFGGYLVIYLFPTLLKNIANIF